MRSPLFGIVITWIVEPLILVGLFLLYRGWKSYVAERRSNEEAD